MPRLLVHVEGKTEESFVHEVLRRHLVEKGYHSVDARIVGNARQHGGIRKWPQVRTDILNHLKADTGCVATTMVDYYAMPQGDPGGWPGRAESATLRTVKRKAERVQEALLNDLVARLGSRFDSRRFVPFVVMHEFGGLLFSDCASFSHGIGRADLESSFQEIRDRFPTLEEINDSLITAPSKRVEALVPGYQKPLLGVLAALEIGLDRIRAECPQFDGWIKQLESLA